MAVGAVAGTKLYIGTSGTVPSPDVSSPDVWIEIGNIANLGDVVTSFSKIPVESVGSGYTRQIKGTESVTPMTIVVNRDDTDAGQIAMRAAYPNRNALFPFKIVENDFLTSTATTSTFRAQVFNSGSKYGGVNTLKQLSIDIEIDPATIVTTYAT